MNLAVHIFFKLMFLLPRIRIMWLCVSCIFTLWGVSNLFSQWLHQFTFSPQGMGLPFFHILSNTCNFLSFWWSPWWQVWGDISLWFWFAFPKWWAMLRIFTGICWPFVCFLRTNICSGLRLFFSYWVICFLHIIWIINAPPPLDICKYLFLFSSLPFCFVDDVLNCTKVF